MAGNGQVKVCALLLSTLLSGAVVAADPPVQVRQVPQKPDSTIRIPSARLFPSQRKGKTETFRERVLLKSDDGTADNQSMLQIGHAGSFQKPAGDWKLTSVIAYLGRIGHADPEEGFTVYVCDINGRHLASRWISKLRVRMDQSRWYMFDIAPVAVPDDFQLIVDLKRRPQDRSIVFIGCDDSKADFKLPVIDPNSAVHYELESRGNWMIRAVLSGNGNKPEALVNARIVPDQVLGMCSIEGYSAYRAPNRKLRWVSRIPDLSKGTGRLELNWDKQDAMITIRPVGQKGSMIRAVSRSLTVDIPVDVPLDFEVCVMKTGFTPVTKKFTVAPGAIAKWDAELKPALKEEELSSM